MASRSAASRSAIPALCRSRSARITDTSAATRCWYSAVRRFAITARIRNPNTVRGTSTTAPNPRRRRARKVMAGRGGEAERAVPVERHPREPAPDNGMRADVEQRLDGGGRAPRRQLERRTAHIVDAPPHLEHVGGVGADPERGFEGARGDARGHGAPAQGAQAHEAGREIGGAPIALVVDDAASPSRGPERVAPRLNAARLPIGQPPPGAGLVTASAWSARRWNGASDAATVKVRSPVTVRLAASVASCDRQEARTSRADTGAPSQNRALSRSVKAQRSPGACS